MKTIRAVVAATLILSGSSLGPASAVAEEASPVLIVEGGGYGHTLGMSQYGAYGQARDGRSASEILGTYYPTTELVSIESLSLDPEYFAVENPLWIGLAEDRKNANFAISAAGGSVCTNPDPSDAENPCGFELDLLAGDDFDVTWQGGEGGCTMQHNEAPVTELVDDVEVPVLVPDCRLALRPDAGATVWFRSFGYAHGAIELRRVPGTGRFHVVNALGLEDYLRGIAEVPAYWPSAALRSQAIAARTFGLNRFLRREVIADRVPGDPGLSESQKTKCWCHMTDTPGDQNYDGVAAEDPAWLKAVSGTEGRIIAYFGPDWPSFSRNHVIEALYGSSNGGVSETNAYVWGSTQYPYLQNIEDPWSADPAINPSARWERTFTPAELASKLGWDEVWGAQLVQPMPGAVVRFTGFDAGQEINRDMSGPELQGTLNPGRPAGETLRAPSITAVRIEGGACNHQFATIVGTEGDDVLRGTPARDVIVGRGGTDVIKAKGGNDLICAGDGHDVVAGGDGDDHVIGGPGRDEISGGRGDDLLIGRKGIDTLDGARGADELRGGARADTLDGGGGRDVLSGHSGNDRLVGGDHRDHLSGGKGSDSLDGSAAYDTCRGGLGLDSATSCEASSGIP